MYADYPPHLIHAGNRDRGARWRLSGHGLGGPARDPEQGPDHAQRPSGAGSDLRLPAGRPGGKVVGRARLYLVGNRLYQVLIAGPDGRVSPETIESYLNSFALLDQGPGAPDGPRPVGPPPAGPPPSGPRQVDRRPANRPAPGSSPRKRPAPAPGPSRALAFYDIPEPASATIDADIPGMGSTPENSEVPGLGGSPEPTATAGAASIRTFKWVDENADVVGGYGDAARADGTKDQHFRLEIDMPPNTIVESVVITSGPNHRWVTKPSDQFWPIAIFQRGRPITRSHVAQVGVFSGSQAFDLYFNTGIGIGPGSAFELEIVFSIGGRRHHRCVGMPAARWVARSARRRPAGSARTRSARDALHARAGPRRHPRTRARARGPAGSARRRIDRGPHLDEPLERRRDDPLVRLGRSQRGRCRDIGPGDRPRRRQGRAFSARDGPTGRDDHRGSRDHRRGRAAMDDQTHAKDWPVAVVSKQQPRNRAQSLRVGAFSGRWPFDLYVESHGDVRPDQLFGVEVVVFIRGTRHHLTARCRRK